MKMQCGVCKAAVSGYYRRGEAYLATRKFEEAIKDFLQVKKLCPRNADAIRKLSECRRQWERSGSTG
ncbi:hypothetical protein CRG98_045979 [Punica granatum]|uniref:Uncharacterized protein n=1 Tax=Punica granatum TaxID=22663 RepID=A0A2I0HPW0_PUNGR|nr:hypothetical protein CRG98_045979 [Punica granatum]